MFARDGEKANSRAPVSPADQQWRHIQMHAIGVVDSDAARAPFRHVVVPRSWFRSDRLVQQVQHLRGWRVGSKKEGRNDVDIELIRPQLGCDRRPRRHRSLRIEVLDAPIQRALRSLDPPLDRLMPRDSLVVGSRAELHADRDIREQHVTSLRQHLRHRERRRCHDSLQPRLGNLTTDHPPERVMGGDREGSLRSAFFTKCQ